jgi:DNA gyrase subunit A
VCEKGYGKRTHIDEFRKQNRGGKGIILIDASDRNGPVVDVKLVTTGDEVMLITDRGQTLRTRADEIRETGRNAQGVKLMTLDAEERVVALERLAESGPEEEAVVGGDSVPPASGAPVSEGTAAPDENGNGSTSVAPPSDEPEPGDLN